MIKACIFDLDGTLAYTLDSMAVVGNAVVEKYGLKPMPVENYKYYCGNGADMLVNGEITRSKSNTPGSKVSYRSFYDSRDNPPRARIDSRYGSAYDYDELVFETRGDAERVLVTLDEIMDAYKMVKVADLYDASGRTPSSVMFNYGWTDIHTASVVRTVDGYYMIRLPRALPLD